MSLSACPCCMSDFCMLHATRSPPRQTRLHGGLQQSHPKRFCSNYGARVRTLQGILGLLLFWGRLECSRSRSCHCLHARAACLTFTCFGRPALASCDAQPTTPNACARRSAAISSEKRFCRAIMAPGFGLCRGFSVCSCFGGDLNVQGAVHVTVCMPVLHV